jgi:hypothetical protein
VQAGSPTRLVEVITINDWFINLTIIIKNIEMETGI